MSIYTLREYNGTAWLSDPIHFTDFYELQDHMLETAKDMDPDQQEEYYYNSIIREEGVDNDR